MQELAPNTILQGRYRIVAPKGRGGMGTVYLAEALKLGRRCAIKEMMPALDASAFETEARLLAALDHPGLPRVHDFFEENGRCYLVMDFVDGETLEEVAQACGGRAPLDVVPVWTAAILDVLEYLHARRPPIIFSDLKPANVMRAANGRIVLVDFGIARLFQNQAANGTLPRNLGSPGYAPPEMYSRSAQADARSDLYSLGATLYRLLSGVEPPDAVRRAAGAELLSLREVDPAIPGRLADAVERFLRINPAERPPNVAAARLLLAVRRTAEPTPPSKVPGTSSEGAWHLEAAAASSISVPDTEYGRWVPGAEPRKPARPQPTRSYVYASPARGRTYASAPQTVVAEAPPPAEPSRWRWAAVRRAVAFACMACIISFVLVTTFFSTSAGTRVWSWVEPFMIAAPASAAEDHDSAREETSPVETPRIFNALR